MSVAARPADPDTPGGLVDAGTQTPQIEPGRGRGNLGRRSILLAAVTMIDKHDRRHLTLRRLDAQLGVEAMAPYHYIHSREDLPRRHRRVGHRRPLR